MNDRKYIQEMVKKVHSGKDEWMNFVIDGQEIMTTTVFVRRFSLVLQDWVRDFLKTSPKPLDFSNQALLKSAGSWQKQYDGEIIHQMMMKSHDGQIVVCIETQKRLMQMNIFKQYVPDGQNKIGG